MDAKIIFVILCLAAVSSAQRKFLQNLVRKTPERIGNLLLSVSQPGARIYKGAELREPLSGGPAEPVEAGAFRWSALGPLGGHLAVAYNAGKDGYSARFAYRARSENLPPGVTQAPFPSPPPTAPPVPTTSTIEPPAVKAGPVSLDSLSNPNTAFDDEVDVDERVSSALMASLVG